MVEPSKFALTIATTIKREMRTAHRVFLEGNILSACDNIYCDNTPFFVRSTLDKVLNIGNRMINFLATV